MIYDILCAVGENKGEGKLGMRNIAIFAHVDAGKTTVSEQLLAHAGAIRVRGAVDAGTAHTDRLPVERRRGISVQASCARFIWRGEEINLIDTPGHSDFAAEVERSLWAPDGAVLVISAAEGVQPQTEALFRALQKAQLPTLLFFNKIDREGADANRALEEFKTLLSPAAAFLDEEEEIMALAAENDDQAAEDYLGGTVYGREKLYPLLRAAMARGKAYPALRGSALKDEGIPALLDAIVDLLPPPKGSPEGPLCAILYAASQDPLLGRAVHARVFSGRLQNRDAVTVGESQRKITQIRLWTPDGRGQDAGVLSAGEIGALYGLTDLPVGTVLGDRDLLPRPMELGRLREPLLAARVTPEEKGREQEARRALMELSGEDPLLSAAFNEETRETTIRAMGKMQLEIIDETLRTRFSLPCRFSPPQLIYRETAAAPCEGFVAYTMPKPCWAVMKVLIEPLPRGGGVEFRSVVAARDIALRYQHQVEKAIPLALRQGMMGWQVTDVRITLIEGNHHEIHTHPLDFIVATPMAVMDGLRRGGTKLLEPVLEARITVPESAGGRVMGDVNRMRGQVISSERAGGMLRFAARIPAAECMDYSETLLQFTGGRGGMTASLLGYQDAPDTVREIMPRRGVNPLDTSKYILAARSALDGGIFDF